LRLAFALGLHAFRAGTTFTATATAATVATATAFAAWAFHAFGTSFATVHVTIAFAICIAVGIGVFFAFSRTAFTFHALRAFYALGTGWAVAALATFTTTVRTLWAVTTLWAGRALGALFAVAIFLAIALVAVGHVHSNGFVGHRFAFDIKAFALLCRGAVTALAATAAASTTAATAFAASAFSAGFRALALGTLTAFTATAFAARSATTFTATTVTTGATATFTTTTATAITSTFAGWAGIALLFRLNGWSDYGLDRCRCRRFATQQVLDPTKEAGAGRCRWRRHRLGSCSHHGSDLGHFGLGDGRRCRCVR
jgi:hypothetical protein